MNEEKNNSIVLQTILKCMKQSRDFQFFRGRLAATINIAYHLSHRDVLPRQSQGFATRVRLKRILNNKIGVIVNCFYHTPSAVISAERCCFQTHACHKQSRSDTALIVA